MYIYTKNVMSERLVNILIFDKMAASEKKKFFVKKITLQRGLKIEIGIIKNLISAIIVCKIYLRRSGENFKSSCFSEIFLIDSESRFMIKAVFRDKSVKSFKLGSTLRVCELR